MVKKKKKVRVLLLSFIFSPNVGGVETHLDELCQYLLRQGIPLTVITYKPIVGNAKASFYQKEKNIEIFRIPWIRWNLFNKLIAHPVLQMIYLIPAILLFSSLFLLFNRKRIDIIQSHGFNMAVAAYILSSIFRIPYTINTHVSFKFTKKNLYSTILRSILDNAESVLVLTESAKKELAKIGVSKKKIAVYHYWVDERFTPIEKSTARSELSISNKKFIILFVGRFIKEKGVLLLLSSINSLSSDIKMIMIGSGPLEREIIEMSKNNKNVTVITDINRNDLPKWYSAADITIIPSFTTLSIYSEGIPRVMIESLSCGTPVVATKAGGLESMLRNNVGFFIEPRSTSITERITLLARERRRLKGMRASALDYVKKTFSEQHNAQIIMRSLYS